MRLVPHLGEGDDTGRVIINDARGEPLFCTCGDDWRENWANVSLALAAPELLEALAEITRMAASMPCGEIDPMTVKDVIGHARAAIAKAKGGA